VRHVKDTAAELATALERVVASLRTMPASRLGARLPGPTSTRADAGRLLARVLAAAAQGVEDADSPTMPAWRSLPEVADLVVGDQVNVLVHDLRVAVAGSPPAEVWTPQGRARLVDVLRDVRATAEEVRRLL
jgi:hypothetical protein